MASDRQMRELTQILYIIFAGLKSIGTPKSFNQMNGEQGKS
mgnify:CR=1 FL=1